MESFLSFLSDLILFTAGIAVLIFWIIVLFGVAVEIYDFFTKKEEEDAEEPLL